MSKLELCSPEGYKVQPLFLEAFPEALGCIHLISPTGCDIAGKNCPFLNDWENAREYCASYKPKGIQPLEVGDILLAEKVPNWVYDCPDCEFGRFSLNEITPIPYCPDCEEKGRRKKLLPTNPTTRLEGVLIEVKYWADYGKHTEPLERMREEFYRMRIWQQKNPYVDLHAVWIPQFPPTEEEYRLFYNYCGQYSILGHIMKIGQFKDYLKEFGRPKCKYRRDIPFIKRSHEEPTDLAKIYRVKNGVSSPNAIALSDVHISYEIPAILGIKKNGHPTKKAEEFYDWLIEIYERLEEIIVGELGCYRRLEEGDDA